MSKTAVVILNWNGREKGLIEQYLPYVVKFSEGAEVYLADNGSEDGSVSFTQKNFPSVKIIRMEKNFGFTGGYNRALKQVDADFFILLNDDVMVSDNWINPIIKRMEEDTNIAVCQPKLLSYRDKTMFEYAGAAGGYIDYLGYPFCAGRVFDNIEKDHGQYDKEREIFWASGAAMFVRADVYRELGGLDEDFFAHMEEIDFCWRAKNKGYKVLYCPQSKVYHYGAATLNANNPKKTFLNFRNNLILLYKNLPENKIKKIFIKRAFLDNLAALVFLFKGEKENFRAVISARKEFKKMKDKFKEKRDKNINSYPSMVSKKSIVLLSKVFHKNLFSDIEKYI